MKRSLTTTASTLFGLLLASGVAVADDHGYYATAVFGLASQSDTTLDFTSNGSTQSVESQFSSGLLAGGALGYAFSSGWRLEGEFTYQSVDADDPGLLAPAPSGDGNYASTGFALNALYDFNLFASPKVKTYLGAGIVRLTEVDIDFEQGGVERSFSNSDTAFQALFGARYRLGENFFLDAGVRYMTASSLRLDGNANVVGQIEANYRPWAATIALGWRF